MADYNPNTTAVKGIEWAPANAGSVTLGTITTSAVMSVLQTTGQVIANEKVYLGAIAEHGGIYALEIFDDENAVPTNLTTLTGRPNADVLTGAFLNQSGSGSNLYASIDEATLDASDYITIPDVTSSTYSGRISVPTLTGKRILAVQVVAVYNGDANFFGVGLNLSGTNYFALSAYGASVSVVGQTITGTFPTNPRTNALWTIADATTLGTTDEFVLSISAAFLGFAPQIYQAYVSFVVVDENRLAFGTMNDGNNFAAQLTANAWNTVAVLTPTGGAWTKDGSGRHLYSLRKVTGSYGSGQIVVPTLAGATAPNPARGFTPTLDPTYGYATAMGSSTPTVFGLVQRTSAPADSTDSQPYSLQVEAKVYNGVSPSTRQQFSNAAVASYGEVRALVKPNSATGNLLIKCRRNSDNVQFGSTITWTPAQVAALPDAGSGWKQLDSQMSSFGVLATGTQYYLEFTDATAADDGTGSLYWSVLCLDVGDATTGVTAGFGGTTDIGTANGTAANRYDLPVSISTIPTAPANFAAAVATQSL